MLLTITLCQIPAQARPLSATELQQVATYFAQFVHELKEPVYMWSWSNGALNAVPDSLRNGIHATASGYWQDLCTHTPADPADCDPNHSIDSWNIYGSGFYLAHDPVTTMDFGGNPRWLLYQVQLSAGLRFVDLNEVNVIVKPPQNIVDEFKSAGCPQAWLADGKLDFASVFTVANPHQFPDATPECKLALRKVFKELLGIDGFFYRYRASRFSECPNAREAFVLADDSKILNLKVFNASSTANREDRLRIQSLFYKAAHDDPWTNGFTFLKTFTSSVHPTWPAWQGTFYSCDQHEGCTWIGPTYCDPENPKNCDYTFPGSVAPPEFPSQPIPQVISQAQVPLSQPYWVSPGLLWKDLDGQTRDQDLGPWIQQNLFQCH
jgi:hypothetical protein